MKPLSWNMSGKDTAKIRVNLYEENA